MTSWGVGVLADVAVPKGLVGGPFGSNLISKDYVEHGVPVIRGANLTLSRYVDVTDAVYVTEEKVARDLAGNTAAPGDLVFTQRGTLGQVGVVPDSVERAVISQSQMRLRVDPAKADPYFVYYWATTHEFLQAIRERAIVVGVPHINLGILGGLPISLPALDEQKRIAGVLGRLDDLIETNREQIEASRAVALAQYLSLADHEALFGDVAALVRDGASGESLAAGTSYVGLEHFATEGGGLMAVGDAGSVISQKSRFKAGDVLYGKLRPYFRKYDRPGFDGVCSMDIWVLRGRAPYGEGIVNAIVSMPEFTDFAMQGSGGTRMPRADWKHVASMVVPVPSADRVQSVEQAITGVWTGIVGLSEEIADLTRTRDELLPLLMSGRVRVG